MSRHDRIAHAPTTKFCKTVLLPRMQTILEIKTTGSGLCREFTNDVVRFVRESGVKGLLQTLFVQHTSCSLFRRMRTLTCGATSTSFSGGSPSVRRALDALDRARRGRARRYARAYQSGAHCRFAFHSGDRRTPRHSGNGREFICSSIASRRTLARRGTYQ